MARRELTAADRAEIATGLKAGWKIRQIARHLGRNASVISREVKRNSTRCGYKMVAADCRAERRRARPQQGEVTADPVLNQVLADLGRSRTPRQIAGRLRLEAKDANVDLMTGSLPADGRTVSYEAIYRFIYALPKGELAKHGVMLRSKRTRRRRHKPLSERSAPIVGMVSIDAREDVADRRVPGHWEGDLVIGARGASAAATLAERTTRFTAILALPAGKDSEHLADALIDHADELPVMMRKSLTWDQGSEMAKHAALTLATSMPVYFAHPHSPWQGPGKVVFHDVSAGGEGG